MNDFCEINYIVLYIVIDIVNNIFYFEWGWFNVVKLTPSIPFLGGHYFFKSTSYPKNNNFAIPRDAHQPNIIIYAGRTEESYSSSMVLVL